MFETSGILPECLALVARGLGLGLGAGLFSAEGRLGGGVPKSDSESIIFFIISSILATSEARDVGSEAPGLATENHTVKLLITVGCKVIYGCTRYCMYIYLAYMCTMSLYSKVHKNCAVF